MPTPCRHLLRAALILTLIAPSVAGAEPAPHATRVRMGTLNIATDIGFLLATKRGYFAAESIDAELTPFATAALTIAPLGTGDLEVASGTVAAGLYNAVSRGVPLRIVADLGSSQPGHEYSTLLIRKDLVTSGRYKTLADLKGMSIAAAAPGTGSEAAVAVALRRGGLNWGDAEIVHMPFPEQVAALRNKRIDAAWAIEPALTVAQRDGLAVRASPDPVYPGQQTAVVIISESFAANRPLADAFMRAFLRGVRDYLAAIQNGHLDGPAAEPIIDMLVNATPLKDRAIYHAMTAFVADPNGRVNTESLETDLAFYRARGLINDPAVTAAKLVDTSFADDAVRSLGRAAAPD